MMNKFLYSFVFILSVNYMFAQNIELKEWEFYSEKDSVKQLVKTPHTWNSVDAFDDEPGYLRGTAFYTTSINIPETFNKYFLHFNGVNQTAEIFVNGNLAGKHIGGYTAFDVDISPYLKIGENEVQVKVNNEHDEKIPPLDADFTFYGGIYRNVYLVKEQPKYFDKINGTDAIRIDPLLDENLNGHINISGSIANLASTNKNYKVKLTLHDIDNGLIATIKESVNAKFELSLNIDGPKLWSPVNPYLYNLRLELLDEKGDVQDAYEHKIGFRSFKFSSDGFLLNGKALKLIGVNRHQDWQSLGNALPVNKHVEDLVKIKEMGSNFLRLAHYPQDMAVYKAADSLGLILWSEIPVVNKVPINEDFNAFAKNSIQMQKEHIFQMRNHPSLVFIGYMNEIFLRMVFDKPEEEVKQKIIEKTLELAQELEDLTRLEAPHHITVMALHGNQIYNETGIADIPMIIGWNLYYGWYEGAVENLGTFLDEEHRKYPNRPLIISEYGVGADQRLHSSEPKKFDFTEDYQFKYHPSYFAQVNERPYVIGMTAWNFADFGSEFRGDAMPHINQKGLVNFDRSPKNIYYWYQAILRPEKKMSRFYRDLPIHISDSPKKQIRIISNQKVILKVNNNAKMKLEPHVGLIEHEVSLKEEVNILKIFNNKNELLDSIIVDYKKANLDKGNILAINFGTEAVFLDDTNQIWIPESEQSILKLYGKTIKSNSSTNIRNTNNDPIYQSSVVGVEKIAINLPKGTYELMLVFSELQKNKKSAYELGLENEGGFSGNLNQVLKVNGERIEVQNLDAFKKREYFITVDVEKHIIIEPTVQDQVFSISAIKIKKKIK